MARAVLTVQETNRVGVAPTATTMTLDGALFNNPNGDIFIEVVNTSAGAPVVTVPTQEVVDGEAVDDKTYTLAASGSPGDRLLIGPWPISIYNDASGNVIIDVDTTAVVDVLAVKVPLQD